MVRGDVTGCRVVLGLTVGLTVMGRRLSVDVSLNAVVAKVDAILVASSRCFMVIISGDLVPVFSHLNFMSINNSCSTAIFISKYFNSDLNSDLSRAST